MAMMMTMARMNPADMIVRTARAEECHRTNCPLIVSQQRQGITRSRGAAE